MPAEDGVGGGEVLTPVLVGGKEVGRPQSAPMSHPEEPVSSSPGPAGQLVGLLGVE